MTASAALSFPRRALARSGPAGLTAGDRLLRSLVVIIMLLEVVVFIEPAPVDAAIMLCLVGALLAGKLNFSGVGAGALVSISVFAVMNIVSLYGSIDMERAISYVAITLYLIASWLFFTGLIGRYGKTMMATLIAGYSIAGLASAFLGAGGYFGFLPFQDQLLLNGRARGLFKDCNVYGPYFVPMALFAILRLTNSRLPSRERLWQLILFAAAALGMLLSFSRACWLNFGVALTVFMAGQTLLTRGPERTRALARKAAFLVACAAAVTIVLNIPAVHEMLELRVTSNGLQDYDRVRFATQELALKTAEQRPLGIGPGQSEEVFDYATHSMYLRILSENGPAALIALLAFIGATLARSATLMRRAADPWIREINLVVFACILGHLVNTFVIDGVHWRHIWVIYALPWASVPLCRYVRPVQVLSRFRTQYPRVRTFGPARA